MVLPVDETPPLHAVARRPCDDAISCPICPSSTRLFEWIEQTTIQPRAEDEPLELTQDDVEPLLIIDEWEQLNHILSQFVESRVDDLHLSMHGLLWNDVGVRYATAYPDIASIRAPVIHAWEDFLRGGLVGYMHLIRPQERLQWHELQLIVEMRPAEVEPPGGGTPILRRISWHYLNDAPQQLAVYQTSGMALYAFLAQAGLTNVCLAPGSRECNLYVEQLLQSPLAPVRLHPGSLVEIFLHGVEEGGEADESGLMQQPRPSRSPDLAPTRLLGLNHINSLFHANQDEALVVQLRRNWPLSTNRPDDLEAVHFVAFPPVPTEQVYLVHFHHDRFSQAHVDDVLILVTISFTAPDGSRIQKARVLWGPKRATRSQFLDFLRLGWFCDQSTVLCWTYLNNQLWMEQASLTRRLEFGDHLRVQIRSDSIQWSDIEYAEEVSCSRRIFVDSPRQGASNPHGAVEDEDDHSEPNSRSRSRSRGPDEPSDEEAYFDEDGESEAESHSLIQIAAHRHRSRQTLSDEQPSTSGQNPHVFDRWCGGGSRGGENCSDITPIAVLLAEHIPQSPSWKRGLSDATLSSSKVTALRDFLVDVQPWPETAFSREWVKIPEAHEFVSLIDMFQEPVASVGDFHIFLDGSFFPSTGASAWAFSVVLRSSDGNYFWWGFTGGLLEDSQGSLHAEAYAFAFALDWVFSTLACSRRPVFVYGDATAVGYGASGSQKIAAGLAELGTLVRHLFCIAQAALPHLEYRHIKAHCGQLDNELVDSLAKAIAKQSWSAHVGVPDVHRWLNIPLLEWAWLLVENFQDGPSSLPFLDDLACSISFPSVPQPHIDPFAASPEVHEDFASSVPVRLKLGSANVRTLKEGNNEGGLSDKIELLGAQLRERDYDILAVQESRARVDRTASFNGITRLVSAADHGQGGVELWINSEGPLSRGSFGPLRATHFHVQTSAPTFLVVNCDHPLLQCTLVVAYAPQSGRAQSEIEEWWIPLFSISGLLLAETLCCWATSMPTSVLWKHLVLDPWVGRLKTLLGATSGVCLRTMLCFSPLPSSLFTLVQALLSGLLLVAAPVLTI